MILNNFIYYILFCSAVLLYGIGFNREAVMCETPKPVLFTAIKSFACVLITYMLMYAMNKFCLIPLNLVEIYPFFTLLIYIAISVFLEVLIQITTKLSASEFAVSFLTVILALNEGITFIDGIIIAVSSLFCFYLLIPILYSIEKRFRFSMKGNMLKQKSLVFLTMVVIMFALYSFNISWLNSGVLK